MQGQGGKGKIGEIYSQRVALHEGDWLDVCELRAQPQYIILTYASGSYTPTRIAYYDGAVLSDYIVNMKSNTSLELQVIDGMLQARQRHSSGTYTHTLKILGAL